MEMLRLSGNRAAAQVSYSWNCSEGGLLSWKQRELEGGPGLSDPFGQGETDIIYLKYFWAEHICIPFCNRDLGVKHLEKEGKGIFLVASIRRMGRSWFFALDVDWMPVPDQGQRGDLGHRLCIFSPVSSSVPAPRASPSPRPRGCSCWARQTAGSQHRAGSAPQPWGTVDKVKQSVFFLAPLLCCWNSHKSVFTYSWDCHFDVRFSSWVVVYGLVFLHFY